MVIYTPVYEEVIIVEKICQRCNFGIVTHNLPTKLSNPTVYFTTRLTSLFGTTICLTISLPSMNFTTESTSLAR